MMTRRIALTTDDIGEAFAELQMRRATGERGWDLAKVRDMPDPPRTVCRYVVFQVQVADLLEASKQAADALRGKPLSEQTFAKYSTLRDLAGP